MRKFSRRLFCCLISIILLGVVACGEAPSREIGSGQSGTDKLELTYYFPTQTSGPLAIAMEEIVDEYNENNDEVHVTAVFTGNYSDTIQKTLTSIAGGNPPNVVLSSGNLMPYLDVDAIIDVKPLIEAEGAGFLDDYAKAFWTIFTFGENIYGVPFQHSAPIMYYNKDIFEKAGIDPDAPPKTWSELEAAIKTIKEYDSNIVPFEFMGDDWMIQAMACSNGGNTFVDERTVSFNSSAVIESVDYWKGLIELGAVNTKSYGGVAENFIAESTAIMFNSTGSMGNISTTATFNWDISNIPANDGKDPAAPLGGGGFVIISNQTDEETKASWEFIKYMTSPEISARWSIVSGYFAVRHSSYDLPEMKSHFEKFPQYANTKNLIDSLVKPYMTLKQTEVSEIFSLALDEAIINNSDTKQTLDLAQKEAEEALEGA